MNNFSRPDKRLLRNEETDSFLLQPNDPSNKEVYKLSTSVEVSLIYEQLNVDFPFCANEKH